MTATTTITPPLAEEEAVETNSTLLTSLLSDSSFSQIQTLTDAGGPVIIILLLMSLLASCIVLLKIWQFLWLGLNRHKPLVDALQSWENKDAKMALMILQKTRNPIARVLEVAIQLKKQRDIDESLAREEVTRIAKRQLAKARSHLRILEVIATLSPLLGLLGTVLGMITAFQKLQGAGSNIDPSILSGGIWEALLTTAAGLIVAIPTLTAFNWLEQKVEQFKLTMEDAMTQIFTANLATPQDIEVKFLKQTQTQHIVSKPTAKNKNDAVAVN